MTDYYPNLRTIVAIFYFVFWYNKGIQPFNVWWLVLIFGIDYIVSMIILNITKRIIKQ